MWFVCVLITFFAWGAADLFYKKSADPTDVYSHLKTAIIVGFVMGGAAIVTLATRDINYNPVNLLVYLPVSLMYIVSMTVGYFGLRYLEVSISSPIQNASGAVSALLLVIFLGKMPGGLTWSAIAMITAGVIILGILEKRAEKAAGPAGRGIPVKGSRNGKGVQAKSYEIGILALLMPIVYCVIDSLGTFFDGWYLDEALSSPLVDVTEETIEDVANVSYQLTFLIAAVLLFVYVSMVKKSPLSLKDSRDRIFAAALETAGQLTYVYALSGNSVAAAPVIGSYCVASLLLGRIFLKEKLSKMQYLAIGLVIAGVITLGIIEGLET